MTATAVKTLATGPVSTSVDTESSNAYIFVVAVGIPVMLCIALAVACFLRCYKNNAMVGKTKTNQGNRPDIPYETAATEDHVDLVHTSKMNGAKVTVGTEMTPHQSPKFDHNLRVTTRIPNFGGTLQRHHQTSRQHLPYYACKSLPDLNEGDSLYFTDEEHCSSPPSRDHFRQSPLSNSSGEPVKPQKAVSNNGQAHNRTQP